MSDDWKPLWIDDPIATVKFDCPNEDGAIVEVAMVVHRPRQLSPGNPFGCGLEQRGLTFKSKLAQGQVIQTDIFGEDSWQALSLAIQYANSRLVYASEQGVIFQWAGETVRMNDLFRWNTAALSEDLPDSAP
jgi:hypothetical protein